MTLVKVVTVMGLILDIIGAVLLAKGIFFESVKELVDKCGIERDRYNRQPVNIHYEGAAIQIVGRCKEIFETRIGLFLLVTGFVLQLVAQFLPNRAAVSMMETLFIMVIPALLVGAAWLLAVDYDERLKQSALLELMDRMLPDSVHASILNLPAGVPYSAIIGVCDIFLKRKLSFSNFPQHIEENHRTPDVWLTLERLRRFAQESKKPDSD